MANTDLHEALTAAGAAAVVAKQVAPVLLEYQRRYAPLVRTLPSTPWSSTVYYFNKRTQIPAGGFVTDGGSVGVSSSTYVENNFTVKLLQSIGAVTGYAEEVTSQTVGSLRAKEIEGAARGLYWDIDNALVWGASAATVNGPAPQFDGLDVICASFSSSNDGTNQGVGGGGIDNYSGATTWGAPTFSPWVDSIDQNAIDATAGGNNAYLSYGLLDILIDMVSNNVSEPITGSDYMFVASPTAISRLAQMSYPLVRYDTLEITPGLIVNTYRNIPLIPSSFLAARSQVMGTVSAATSGSGSLTGAQYYRVAPVVARFGEIQASPECTASPTAGGVALTWTNTTYFEGGKAISWKVYRSTTTGTETLLGYVDGQFYDSSSTAWTTTKIVDTGTTLVAYNASNVQANPPATYVYTNTNIKPKGSQGQEDIYLISRDPDNIVRPYVREMRKVDLAPTISSPDALPFAFLTDTTLAVRATKYIGRLANVICALDRTAGNGSVQTATWSPSWATD